MPELPSDYWGFGTSEGTPRRLVDPGRQLGNWRATLDHARSLDDVDAERVVVWGSSFSGGNALAMARSDPVVGGRRRDGPFVDGRAVRAHQTAHLGAVERAGTFGRALTDRLLPIGPMEAMVEHLPDASVHRVVRGLFGPHTDPWFDEVVDRQVGFLRGALSVTD